VNHGNSGGPLLSTKTGEVLGLVDLKETDASGIGFAVSARLAQPMLGAWRTAPQPASAAAADCGKSTESTPRSSSPTPAAPHAAPRVTSYNDKYFSLLYPDAWRVVAADEGTGTYLDTTIRSDKNANVMLRVDVTPLQHADPMTAAQQAEQARSLEPGYTKISFSRTSLAGYDAVRWEYLTTQSALSLHTVETFFTTVEGNEYAVWTQTPANSYFAWKPLLDRLAESLVAYGHH
jgi:hypothetical protein